MPRNGRNHGGARAGRPGAQYGNRSDLQTAPRTAPAQPIRTTDQGYGTQTAQRQAQQAQPLPDFANMALARPTERPTEPVTAGAPMGAGPGTEILRPGTVSAGRDDDSAALIRAVYDAYPTDELADLLIELDARGL